MDPSFQSWKLRAEKLDKCRAAGGLCLLQAEPPGAPGTVAGDEGGGAASDPRHTAL